MTIRFSFSPAEATLTIQLRDQALDVIESALDRAAETSALEIFVMDGSSNAHWAQVAESCMRRGPRFVYRRMAGRRSTAAA